MGDEQLASEYRELDPANMSKNIVEELKTELGRFFEDPRLQYDMEMAEYGMSMIGAVDNGFLTLNPDHGVSGRLKEIRQMNLDMEAQLKSPSFDEWEPKEQREA